MKRILIVLFIGCCVLGYGQKDYNPLCGFDTEFEKSLQNETFRKQVSSLEEKLLKRSTSTYNSLRTNITIPIVVHIIHPPNTPIGQGNNITDEQVNQGLEFLNRSFENTGEFQSNEGVDVGIQFCLAKRTPDGLPTNGITRNASDLVAEPTCSEYSTDQQNSKLIKDLISWDCKNYINVWLVTNLYNQSFGCSLAGFATFPSTPCGYDGVVQESRYWTTVSGTKITAHEFGHFLGLYHTFNGGCNNDNCELDGDRVCDTPPDASQSFASCNTNSCQSDSPDVQDDNSNIMDYSNCPKPHFTEGQKERMLQMLEVSRGSLLSSSGCNPVLENDLALRIENDPDCPNKYCLKATITNTGSNEVTHFELNYESPGNVPAQSYSWTGNLAPSEEARVYLDCHELSNGDYLTNAEVVSVNGINDSYPSNSQVNRIIIVKSLNVSFDIFTITGKTKLFKNQSPSNLSYLWDYGDGNTSNKFEERHTYLEGGTYKVTLFAYSSCDTVMVSKTITVQDCVNGWRAYTFNAFQTSQSPDINFCDVTVDGSAYIDPSLRQYSWTNFEYCGEVCTGPNFEFSTRLKNTQNKGGINAYDVIINIFSEGENVSIKMVGAQWAQQYTRVSAGSTSLSNLPKLVLPFEEWVEVKIKFDSNILYFYHEGIEIFQLPYDANICNIEKIRIYFKGSGEIDWIKVNDLNQNLVYQEDFDDCNNLSQSSPCENIQMFAELEDLSTCEDHIYSIGAAGGKLPHKYYLKTKDTFYYQTESIFTIDTPGQYTLGVLDDCPYQDTSFVINIPEKLEINELVVQSQNCNSLGQIQVEGNGGIPPYEYQLDQNDWQDRGDFLNLSTGTYTIHLRDDSGCETSHIYIIEDLSNDIILKIDSMSLDITCVDTFSYIHIHAEGSDPYYHYSLDNGAETTVGLFNNISAGIHTINCRDEFGCTAATYQFEVIDKSNSHDITNNIFLCEGNQYQVGSNIYEAGGNYIDSLLTVTGCDSIIHSMITIVDEDVSENNIIMCEGDFFQQGGNIYTDSGQYTDTLATIYGCDSISRVNLTFFEKQKVSQNIEICANESYNVGGNIYTQGGHYIDTLTNQNGCDSIILTELNIIPTNDFDIEESICIGDSLSINNTIYYNAGMYTDTLTNQNGCDSIIYINIDNLTDNYCEELYCKSYIPNIFSPNGDGNNDYFEISSEVADIVYMEVYDRWGNIIFNSNELNARWDGTSSKYTINSGVYIYHLISRCANGIEQHHYGDVMVVK